MSGWCSTYSSIKPKFRYILYKFLTDGFVLEFNIHVTEKGLLW